MTRGVYLDEMSNNAHNCKNMAWEEKDEITGGTVVIQHLSGKICRFITSCWIREWVVPNHALVFKSEKSTGK